MTLDEKVGSPKRDENKELGNLFEGLSWSFFEFIGGTFFTGASAFLFYNAMHGGLGKDTLSDAGYPLATVLAGGMGVLLYYTGIRDVYKTIKNRKKETK